MRNKGISYKCAAVLLILIAFNNFSRANRIINVDNDGVADFNNIQAAIDDANDGDTVLVADGTYTGDGNRDIDFKGKAITLKSQNGAEKCIIDCNGSDQDLHRGFYFQSGEGNDSVLDGFTIMNGYNYNGGGIRCSSSSPTIKNSIICDNISATDRSGGLPLGIATSGGGIYSYSGNLKIINCDFYCNKATSGGGAIYSSSGSSSIINCKFSNNFANQGGAILLFKKDTMQIKNCVISGNCASNGGGGINCSGSSSGIGAPIISNCTIIGNLTDGYSGGISCMS
jgi:hypothetical protein